MTKREIAAAIKKIIRWNLDDAESAARRGDADRAKREIEDAIGKLKKLARQLEAEPD